MVKKHFVVGPLGTNCYLIADEEAGAACFVDPGDDAAKLIAYIEQSGYKLEYILLTHAHHDHTGALDALTERWDVPVYLHKADAEAKIAAIKERLEAKNAFQYKYLFETDEDKESLDLLFANVDDPNDTIESIINFIISNGGKFNGVESWEEFKSALYEQTQTSKAAGAGKEISVLSWRKFYRLFNKSFQKCRQMFTEKLGSDGKSVRLRDQIAQIHKNDVMVIDVAKLDEESQGFVFGDVMRAVYNLKLGSSERPDEEIPDRIIIFIDELNKYASTDVPKSSPILRQLLDITERGRSLGIVLFGAEQFVSDIHKRVKGNCATQAFGRTNAIEITKEDFRFVPAVYKTMLTRLKQGEYIIQNPVFRSMLNVNFPLPIYKYYD